MSASTGNPPMQPQTVSRRSFGVPPGSPPRGLVVPIVPELSAALVAAAERLRMRISNVRLRSHEEARGEVIGFDFDGTPYVGLLCGRNKNLCVGFGQESDRAIAVRVLIDGDAQPE